jgi:toxin-antitoxin system PIN domain toxin
MRSSTTSLFPDINVWVALSYEGHVHHLIAADWFSTLPPDTGFAFCRFTQLGFLRLLTAEAVMRDEVMTQPKAWDAYDRWMRDPHVAFMDEPQGIDILFRALTRLRQPATKDWADSYLAAFATAGQLTLVTFDRGLQSKATASILLSE